MKRFWIALSILVLLFAASLLHTRYLGHFVDGLTDQLTQAEAMAEHGDWEGAAELTRQAGDLWLARSGYLHITLRHADADQIYLLFCEVRELISSKETGEYAAANARLIASLSLLEEAEELTLKNIF